MNPKRRLPDEIFPAAIHLIHHELLPAATPQQQRWLVKVARYLAHAHRQLTAHQRRQPPARYVGLLPPRDAHDFDFWCQEVRRRREECGLTRLQLAKLAGMAEVTLYDLETGLEPPSRAVVMQLQAVAMLGLPAPPERELIPPPPSPALKRRAGAAEFLCSCWFAPEYEAIRLTRDMIQRFNGIGGHIDQAFFYRDAKSAVAWCAVTEQADYPQRQLPIAELAAELAARVGPLPLDVIGLGAGEAKEEVRLVQALLGQPGRGDLRLFLLDLSQPLLSVGYRHAARVLGDAPDVGVFAIQGDFHNLPSYTSLFEPTSRRRVLCMFGDTFCTLENEIQFMRSNLGGLAVGDLFIVDVPLTATPTDQLIELLKKDPAAPQRNSCPELLSRLHEFLVGPFRRYVQDLQSVSLSRELAMAAALVPGSHAVDFRAHVQTASGPARVFSVGGMSKRYDATGLRSCLGRQGWEQVKEWRYGRQRHPRLLLMFRKAKTP